MLKTLYSIINFIILRNYNYYKKKMIFYKIKIDYMFLK